MRIHLVRSAEIAIDRYDRLLGFFQSFRGPMQFIGAGGAPNSEQVVDLSVSEKERILSFEKVDRKKKPWSSFFNQAKKYRIEHDSGDDEFVVILTDCDNEHNWFSAPDTEGGRNIFVQTSGWESFLEGESNFPVAFQVLANVFRFSMADGWHEFDTLMHDIPRGCINDFCGNKEEVILQLRTADICPDCARRLTNRNVDGAMVAQVFEILESIRANVLFRERLTLTQRPSRIRISGPSRMIDFPDLPNCILKLTPLEKTVYLFFLNHPEGILFNHLSDYTDEVRRLYEELNPNLEKDRLEESVQALVAPLSQSLSEKIAKIKSKLNALLGPRLAEYYIISGGSSQHRRIGIDRSLVLRE